MSASATELPDDPALLKATIAALEAENAKMSASLRAHDLLVQSLRARIAKLQKQAFGKSSEKIECEIERLELVLEDLQVALAEADTTPGANEDDAADEEVTQPGPKSRRRPKVSGDTPRVRREFAPATPARTVAGRCGSWAKM